MFTNYYSDTNRQYSNGVFCWPSNSGERWGAICSVYHVVDGLMEPMWIRAEYLTERQQVLWNLKVSPVKKAEETVEEREVDRISRMEINWFLTVLGPGSAPRFCSEFLWIDTSIPGELVKTSLIWLLWQDEMHTADLEKGVKAGKAEMWHSQVLSIHLMTVNSEDGKISKLIVCDRRVKVTLRHHFLKVELNLLFCIFMEVIHEHTVHLPLAFSYHGKQLASQSTQWPNSVQLDTKTAPGEALFASASVSMG